MDLQYTERRSLSFDPPGPTIARVDNYVPSCYNKVGGGCPPEPILVMERGVRMLSEYRLSPRVMLRPGDIVRLSSGPYYLLPDGTKRRAADRGLAVISEITERDDGEVFLEGAMISPTHHCRITNMHARITGSEKDKSYFLVDRPYKVSKPRRPPRIEPFPIPIPPRGRGRRR